MKLFDNLEKMWEYCEFCPVCQKNSRKIYVYIGPEDIFEIESYTKDNGVLDLCCFFIDTTRLKYDLDINIDCITNSFDITWPTGNCDKLNAILKDKFLYIYVQSFCKGCSDTYSADIEASFLDKKFSNMKLEKEVVLLKQWLLITNHEDSKMYLIKDRKKITLPIINFDYSDPQKVIDRLKTLIIFT